ncbi:WYL domain-containing protein [Streptomyces scabiei]|uniref:WYL domain-containing protein n=1 Tax=Streptomyces scabiei TaxID=1930 RepID=UPI0038F7D0B8
MKLTKNQTQTKTIADLYRAIDRQHAMTITYTDRDGTTTIRTIEPFAFSTTKAGGIRVHAMCRLAAAENPDDAERAFTVSRISAYTAHRIAFVLTRPEPTTYEREADAPADNETAIVHFELERDPDDADYRPRVKLIQSQTDLAA